MLPEENSAGRITSTRPSRNADDWVAQITDRRITMSRTTHSKPYGRWQHRSCLKQTAQIEHHDAESLQRLTCSAATHRSGPRSAERRRHFAPRSTQSEGSYAHASWIECVQEGRSTPAPFLRIATVAISAGERGPSIKSPTISVMKLRTGDFPPAARQERRVARRRTRVNSGASCADHHRKGKEESAVTKRKGRWRLATPQLRLIFAHFKREFLGTFQSVHYLPGQSSLGCDRPQQLTIISIVCVGPRTLRESDQHDVTFVVSEEPTDSFTMNQAQTCQRNQVQQAYADRTPADSSSTRTAPSG